MFSVDYPTLEQIVRQFMHTGIFRAQVAKSRLIPEDGYIDLQAKEGVVIACRFVTRQGETRVWERWGTELAKLGVLNWEQMPDTAMQSRLTARPKPLPQQPVEPANNRPSLPYHAIILNAYQTQQLPMLYRQLYYLIDGKRQVSDIALILHKSEQEVVQAKKALIRKGIIALK